MDFKQIDAALEAMLPDMKQDLAELVSYPSTEAAAEPGAPFGKAVAGALAKAMEISGRKGFTTENAGYYGLADYGDVAGAGSNYMAVLGHLDVVPAVPEEWTSDPFTLTEDGNKLTARGTIDDKGPMLAALYGAVALKAAGYEPRIPLRFIFGTNEESGMAGVAEYIKKRPMPLGGFTPDASWPVIIGEKGIYGFSLSDSWASEDCGAPLTLVSFHSGTVSNIVPGKAEAVFSVNEGAELSFPAAEGIETGLDGDEIVITATGRASHGSTPELGDNALTKLLRYIDRLDFGPAGAKEYISALTRLTLDDKLGTGMGLNGDDGLSVTTVSPNILHIEDNAGGLTCDMRFMITKKRADCDKLLDELGTREGLTVTGRRGVEPLYVSADTPLVQSLLEAYSTVTGSRAEPLIIGGGTYAKAFPGMVAFGPEPEDGEMRCHIADEYITKEELLASAKIYARAIYSITR